MALAPLRLKPGEYGAFFAECVKGTPLLISDYDGTLAPFSKRRDEALVKPDTRRLLSSIIETDTRLVILTGRPSKEAAGLLSLPVEIWGCHGMERLMPDGRFSKADVPVEAAAKIDNLRFLLEEFPNSAVESKASGVAVHWRDEPKIFAMYRKISKKIVRYAREAELKTLRFKGGVEFVMPYFSKGTALKKICDTYPASSPVCYMGDDITDEDAFREIRKIICARGILVSDEPRESFADARIHGGEIDMFLEFWRDRIANKEVKKL